MLRRLDQRREKVHGVLKFHNKAPAYGHGRTGTEDINGVGRVGRGYIVKFPHPMHFLPSGRVLGFGGLTKEGKKYMGC
jgi:hypothetical protein